MTSLDLLPFDLIILIDEPLEDEEGVAPIVIDDLHIRLFELSDIGYDRLDAWEEWEYLVEWDKDEDGQNNELDVDCSRYAFVDVADGCFEGFMELGFGPVEHGVVAGSEVIMKKYEIPAVHVYLRIVGKGSNRWANHEV